MESSTLTRSSILSWVNRIFHTDYDTFSQVPASNLALLIYAVVRGEHWQPLVSLQEIQFTAHPTPTVLLRNAQHVLKSIHRLSTPYEQKQEEHTNRTLGSQLHGYPTTLLGPHVTPAAWVEGRAFIEELKVWRWLRLEAMKRNVAETWIEAEIQSYLKGSRDPSTTLITPSSLITTAAGSAAAQTDAASLAHVAEGKPSPQDQTFGMACQEGNADEALGFGDGVPAKRNRVEEDSANLPPAPTLVPAMAEASQRHSAMGEGTVIEEEVNRAVSLLSVLDSAKRDLAQTYDQNMSAGGDKENHMHSTIDDTTAGGAASGGGVGRNTCAHCPEVFSRALQANITAIESMERIRKQAIAACMRKDEVALLSVLSSIV